MMIVSKSKIGAMIVDDESDIRLLIRMVIEAANQGLYVSGEAADGQEALERVEELDPEVIVLDERMPGMSGFETALKLLQRRPGQRIIVCSAHLNPEVVKRFEDAGVTVCLSKGQVSQIPDELHKIMGVDPPV